MKAENSAHDVELSNNDVRPLRRLMPERWPAGDEIDLDGRFDFNHRVQNRVPCGGSCQHGIGEHAAIPADVLNAAIGIILQPIGRTTRHVEFAVGIVCRAVLTGFVVIPRAVYGAVVLSDMPPHGRKRG